MSDITRELRDLLNSFVECIDKGNTNITEEQALFLLDAARKVADNKMSKYQAARYLGLNTKQFDYKVSKGEIPRGRKEAGFKELFWYKTDLENIPKDK